MHRHNTAGKRAKEAASDYEEAKKGEGNLANATNELSNALDKLLVEAADILFYFLKVTYLDLGGKYTLSPPGQAGRS